MHDTHWCTCTLLHLLTHLTNVPSTASMYLPVNQTMSSDFVRTPVQLSKHKTKILCVAGGPQSFLNILPFQKAQGSFVTLEQSILPAFVPPKPLDRVLKGVCNMWHWKSSSAHWIRSCCIMVTEHVVSPTTCDSCDLNCIHDLKHLEPVDAWRLILSCRNLQQASTDHTARPEAGSGPTVSELRVRCSANRNLFTILHVMLQTMHIILHAILPTSRMPSFSTSAFSHSHLLISLQVHECAAGSAVCCRLIVSELWRC